MLKSVISPTTGKPVKKMYLQVGERAATLIKTLCDISNTTASEMFVKSMEPVCREIVNDLYREPDSNVEQLHHIELAMNEIFDEARMAL